MRRKKEGKKLREEEHVPQRPKLTREPGEDRSSRVTCLSYQTSTNKVYFVDISKSNSNSGRGEESLGQMIELNLPNIYACLKKNKDGKINLHLLTDVYNLRAASNKCYLYSVYHNCKLQSFLFISSFYF